MPAYKCKSRKIEAHRYGKHNGKFIQEFMDGDEHLDFIMIGDWVMRDEWGEFQTIGDSAFHDRYEKDGE